MDVDSSLWFSNWDGVQQSISFEGLYSNMAIEHITDDQNAENPELRNWGRSKMAVRCIIWQIAQSSPFLSAPNIRMWALTKSIHKTDKYSLIMYINHENTEKNTQIQTTTTKTDQQQHENDANYT